MLRMNIVIGHGKLICHTPAPCDPQLNRNRTVKDILLTGIISGTVSVLSGDVCITTTRWNAGEVG